MSKSANSKLPILGNISVPLRLMHYDEKDVPGQFFQSGIAYFKLQDSICDVSDDEGNPIGSLGGTFSGHYEATFKKDSLYVILDVEEMWKGITDVVGSDSAKAVFEGIKETYEKYWADHEKVQAENLNIMESKKAALEEKRKADEAKREKEEREGRERLQRAKEAEIRRSEAKLKKKMKDALTEWKPEDKGAHESYRINKVLILNDGGWDLSKDLDHMHDYDFADNGIKIPVNMGCGVKAIDEQGRKCWTPDVNRDNKVELRLYTYRGISPDAVHYYAKLKFSLPELRRVDEEGVEHSSSEWDLKLLGMAEIELTRPFEQWERENDPERWRGYRTADEPMPSRVNAWYDIPSAKKRAKEVFDQIFGEGWKLKILPDKYY
jgi:hypothetical protein